MMTLTTGRDDGSGVRFEGHSNKDEAELNKIIKAYKYSIQSEASLKASLVIVEDDAPKRVKERIISKYGPRIFITECLDKLIILRTMMGEKVDSKWYREIEYKPPEVRFTSDDDEEFALYRYTNNRKLTKDICIIHNILNIALEGLQGSQSIKEFLEAISVLEKENEDVLDLCDDFENNLLLLEKLNVEMADSYKRNQQRYNKKLDAIYKLNHTYEDMVLYSRIERNYVNNWEDDRCYLNDFRNNGRVNDLRNMIQQYNEKIDNENRIHKEICKFLEDTMDTHGANIDEWADNYDKELERYEGELFEVKVDRERWETEFGLLKKEYESRSDEMTRWLKFKEEMKKQAELDMLRNDVATKIQAWWRGVMVRRHLGPFKKKKKGQKGQKGKNKKGKKK